MNLLDVLMLFLFVVMTLSFFGFMVSSALEKPTRDSEALLRLSGQTFIILELIAIVVYATGT